MTEQELEELLKACIQKVDEINSDIREISQMIKEITGDIKSVNSPRFIGHRGGDDTPTTLTTTRKANEPLTWHRIHWRYNRWNDPIKVNTVRHLR